MGFFCNIEGKQQCELAQWNIRVCWIKLDTAKTELFQFCTVQDVSRERKKQQKENIFLYDDLFWRVRSVPCWCKSCLVFTPSIVQPCHNIIPNTLSIRVGHLSLCVS